MSSTEYVLPVKAVLPCGTNLLSAKDVQALLARIAKEQAPPENLDALLLAAFKAGYRKCITEGLFNTHHPTARLAASAEHWLERVRANGAIDGVALPAGEVVGP